MQTAAMEMMDRDGQTDRNRHARTHRRTHTHMRARAKQPNLRIDAPVHFLPALREFTKYFVAAVRTVFAIVTDQ